MTDNYRSDTYTSEIDLSFTTQLRSASYIMACGESKEGPLTPEFITDGPDGVSIYGKPDARVSMLHHSFIAFLKEGGGAWIKRVTDGTADTGGALVQNLGDSSGRILGAEAHTARAPDDVDLDTAGNADDVEDTLFYIHAIGPGKYSSNIQCDIASNNLTVPVATITEVDGGAWTGSPTHKYRIGAVSSLGETLPSDQVEATPSATTKALRTSWAAIPGAQGYRVYREATADFDVTLPVAVSGGTGDATVDSITVTSGQITGVTWGDHGTGYVAGNVLTFRQGGVYATYTVLDDDRDDVAGVLEDLTGITALQGLRDELLANLSPSATSYTDNGTVSPQASTNPPTVAPTADAQFILNVYDTRISRVTPVESHECSLRERLNGLGEQTEVTQSVNNKSDLVRVVSNVFGAQGDDFGADTPTITSLARFTLSEGTDGGTITAAHLASAAEEFKDKESYPAAMFLDAGYALPAWHKKMQEVCDDRGDSVAFTVVPATEQKAQDSIAFRAITQNINSNRVALFTNDHYVLDEYNGGMLHIPASAVAAARVAYTDRVANQAYSPAGFRRGIARNTLKLREKYTKSERDQMAVNGVNYFTTERGAGFVLREAYTLQAAYSALSFISVRRVLDIIEQSTERSLKIYLQEPNDDILVLRLLANLRKFYGILRARRMIKTFEVISKTPPGEVDLGNLDVYTLVTPLLPAVRIRHKVVLTRQGVSFSATLEQLGLAA